MLRIIRCTRYCGAVALSLPEHLPYQSASPVRRILELLLLVKFFPQATICPSHRVWIYMDIY